jgi:HK97 family phage portal protein
MGLIDTFKGWFRGGTKTKSRTLGGSYGGLMLWAYGKTQDHIDQEAVLASFHENPALNKPITLISQTVASVPLHMKRRGKDLDDHEFLDILNRPNIYHTKFTFIKTIQEYIDLLGSCYLYKIRSSDMGVEILPVSPHNVTQTDEGTYEIAIGGVSVTEKGGKNLIKLIQPDLRDPYNTGIGYGALLSDEIDIEDAAARHEAAFLNNHAMRQAWVNMPDATDDQIEAFNEAWRRQNDPSDTGKMATTNLENGVEIVPLDHDFDAEGLIRIREHAAEVIRTTLGVPGRLIGQDEGSALFENMNAVDHQFKKNVIVPRMKFLVAELSVKLLPMLYPDPDDRSLSLAFNEKDVVPRDKQFALDMLKTAKETFTLNEVRALRGVDPIEGGDVLLESNSRVSQEVVPKPELSERSYNRSTMVAPMRGNSLNEHLDFYKLGRELNSTKTSRG